MTTDSKVVFSQGKAPQRSASIAEVEQLVAQAQANVEADVSRLSAETARSILAVNDQLIGTSLNVKYPPVPMIAAKGDGTTNDTNALKNLLQLNNKIIEFPDGEYITDQYISVPSGKVVWSKKAIVKGYGFQAIGKSNITINGFRFVDAVSAAAVPRAGIWLEDCSSVEVASNSFENTRLYMKNTKVDQSFKNVRILSNDFKGDYAGYTDSDILLCGGLNGVIISGNIFDCKNTIRFMKLTTAGSVDSGNGYNHITDSYSKNLIVTNNIIKGSMRGGKQVIDCYAGVGESSIKGNVIEIDKTSDAGSAIELKCDGLEPTLTGTNKQRNVIISENVISCPSNAYSIMAYGAYGLPFEGEEQIIAIDGNIIRNTKEGSISLDGIRVRGFHHMSTSDNKVYFASTHNYIKGISIGSCKNALVTQNILSKGSIAFNERETGTTGSGFTYQKPFKFILVSDNVVDDWKSEGGVIFYGGFQPSNVKILVTDNLLSAVSTVSPASRAIYFSGGTYNQVTILGNSSNAEDNAARNTVYKLAGSVFTNYSETNNSWNPNISYGAAIPTTGTFKRGDIIYNTTPTAGGYTGWICITAGTPGTWKGFGLIEA